MPANNITYAKDGPDSIWVRTTVRRHIFFLSEINAASVRFKVEGDELLVRYRATPNDSWDLLDPAKAAKFSRFDDVQIAAGYYLRETHSTDWLFYVPITTRT